MQGISRQEFDSPHLQFLIEVNQWKAHCPEALGLSICLRAMIEKDKN